MSVFVERPAEVAVDNGFQITELLSGRIKQFGNGGGLHEPDPTSGIDHCPYEASVGSSSVGSSSVGSSSVGSSSVGSSS
ncbi:MAG: hypothetical protein QF419_01570, partial [Acidimicrobiales bacterium]|nr:hypothetical protein [Acidimicrobiales bacterium]